MAKGKAKGGKPQAAATSDTARLCGTCGEEKAKAEYTGGQWKKDERQCKPCTAAEDALLKPVEDAHKKKLEEEKKKKEEELAASKEKQKEAPEGEKAKQKRFEIAVTKVLQDEGELSEKVEYASYLEINIEDIKDDSKAIQDRLFVGVRGVMMNRTSAERAMHNAYLKTLDRDELLGLACELDLLVDELKGADDAAVVEKIKVVAKDKSNQRRCETCDAWKTKADFGQNQWKKTNGSRCKMCMQQEAEEKKFFDDYKRMYGQPPPEEMEDEVYTSQENLYETLNLKEDCSQDEIKTSYRKLAIKFHPDRWASAAPEKRDEAEETFKLITEAYETLSNSSKKAQYDKDMQRKARKAKKKAAAQAKQSQES